MWEERGRNAANRGRDCYLSKANCRENLSSVAILTDTPDTFGPRRSLQRRTLLKSATSGDISFPEIFGIADAYKVIEAIEKGKQPSMPSRRYDAL